MSVAKNATYNLSGTIVSVAITLFTVPAYLNVIGEQRYGIIVIAWLLIGYFGLLDLGLGRSTLFNVAKSRENKSDTNEIFWTALIANAAIGFLGAALLWLASSFFFGSLISASDSLKEEALLSLPFLAAMVPLSTVSGVLNGTLQGYSRFLQTSAISTLSTFLMQVVPLVVALTLSKELQWLIAAIMLAKFTVTLALAYLCRPLISSVNTGAFNLSRLKSLLAFSFWVGATSILGPILFLVDRFMIATLLGAAAVAVYTVPFQITNRLAVIPQALTSALFPRLAAASEEEQKVLSGTASRALVSLVTPAALCAIFVIEPFLTLWVGSRLSELGAPVGRILVVGIWFNAFSLIAFTRIQASGRPWLITVVILIQIPLHLAGLYLSLTYYGLIGCALVSTVRNVLDWILLSYVAGYRPPLRLIGTNLLLLLASLACASTFSPARWEWWTTGALLGCASCVLSFRTLPVSVRTRLQHIWMRSA